MKKLFDNKTDYLVLAFIIGAIIMLAMCESADAAWGIEEQHDSNAGITSYNGGLDRICGRYTYDTGTSFYGCPVVALGGEVEKGAELGLADELFPRWEAEIKLLYVNSEMFGGGAFRRVIGDGPFQLALGMTHWVTESPGSSSSTTYNLSLRYTWSN